MEETIILDVINTLQEKWYESNFSESLIEEITSTNFIDNVAVYLNEIRELFVSDFINNETWEYYEFSEFSASLPKENWSAEDVVNAEKAFIEEIKMWFIKAQAIAIYEDRLEEFYLSIFAKEENTNEY